MGYRIRKLGGFDGFRLVPADAAMWRQLERAETAGNVASILADLLGVSESRAANWAVAARGDWACYAADASRQLQPR